MFEIILAGCMGALGATLAYLVLLPFRGLNSQGAPRSRLLFGLLTGAFMYIGTLTLSPPLRSRWHEYEVSRYLRSDSLWSALLEDKPELEASLRLALLQGMQPGRSDEGISRVRELVVQVFPAYLSHAPNELAVSYARAMVKGLQRIAARDPARCYCSLFPKICSPSTVNQDDPELLKRMTEVVRTASRSPVQAPSEEDVAPALDDVLSELRERHGDDALILDHVEDVDVDRAKVCELAIDLYMEILTRPTGEAGPLLRFLMSQ